MKLLNLFMGLFKKKKAVPDGLAAKDEIKTDAAIILAAKDEIKTDAAIIGDSIHHISISPEEYHRITRQLNYNQLSQFTTMELVKRQLQTKRQGE